MQENDKYKDYFANERSYALTQIFAKSNNIRASLKIKYLISKLGKSFSADKKII